MWYCCCPLESWLAKLIMVERCLPHHLSWAREAQQNRELSHHFRIVESKLVGVPPLLSLSNGFELKFVKEIEIPLCVWMRG